LFCPATNRLGLDMQHKVDAMKRGEARRYGGRAVEGPGHE
jgi:hypothetical protein